MRLATPVAALLLLATGIAAAQNGRPEASPAYAVGQARAMLMDAAPCFPRANGGAEVEALLHASLAIVQERPDYQQAYSHAMMRTRQQQRYIARSDPVACAEIRGALQYFLAMHQQRR
jgi:hypothetical protein